MSEIITYPESSIRLLMRVWTPTHPVNDLKGRKTLYINVGQYKDDVFKGLHHRRVFLTGLLN